MAFLVNVFTFVDHHEAEVAKRLLSRKNIPSVIHSETPTPPPKLARSNTHIRLMVKEEDLKEAKEILRVLQKTFEELRKLE